MKQCILVRTDLKMDKGKLAVQCSHASVEAVLNSNRNKVMEWHSIGMKKVVLKVDNLRELKKYQRMAKKEGLLNVVITDAAKTFFKRPTVTCMAIGPDSDSKIDLITKDLKML